MKERIIYNLMVACFIENATEKNVICGRKLWPDMVNYSRISASSYAQRIAGKETMR